MGIRILDTKLLHYVQYNFLQGLRRGDSPQVEVLITLPQLSCRLMVSSPARVAPILVVAVCGWRLWVVRQEQQTAREQHRLQVV